MTRHDVTPLRQWQFNPKLLVFSGLFLPVLLGLGIWQLERAGEKERQLQQWQQQATELSWQQLWQQVPEPGQPVVLKGQFTGFSWLLDNRTRDGVAGYEVMTLFEAEDGPSVVVNRGWLRAPARRETLPAFPTPLGIVQIRGRLAMFPQPPVLDTQPPAGNWPRRVQALTAEQAGEAGPSLAPLVLRLAGGDQPGAFRADWQPDRMGPQTHYGYALQWFSLALALVILTVVASYRRAAGSHTPSCSRMPLSSSSPYSPSTTGAANDNDNGQRHD
ncbi:MAG: SURF1 family protein [Marinobacter sp.]|nr:SURF1 family protein [Marinobacter sp.]